MKTLCTWVGVSVGLLTVASVWADERDDRALIARAAAQRETSTPGAPAINTRHAADAKAAPAAAQPEGDDSLAPEERRARTDVALSQIRLELVLARKALKGEDWNEAARRATAANKLIAQLPRDVDVSVWELQAEGILSKAEKAGVNLQSLKNEKRVAGATAARQDKPATAPPAAAPQPAPSAPAPTGSVAVVAPTTPGSSSPPLDVSAKPEKREGVFELEVTPEQADEMRLQYEEGLYNAYKAAEERALVEADEARLIPNGWIGYPSDWADICKRRAHYAGGEVARSDTWKDKDGKEWYAAIYDIRDLTYEVPDFQCTATLDPVEDLRNTLDRDALRNRSWIFGGTAEDLAHGIPLLRYFGGVDDMEFRGPKYSIEKQKQIMDQIRAFTTPSTEAKIIPLGAP